MRCLRSKGCLAPIDTTRIVQVRVSFRLLFFLYGLYGVDYGADGLADCESQFVMVMIAGQIGGQVVGKIFGQIIGEAYYFSRFTILI